MNADILAFPRCGLPAAIVRDRTYSFACLCRVLALQGSARTCVDHLRALARQAGLPLPRNPRLWRGVVQSGDAGISTRSVWIAAEIDAWLERRGAPPPSAAPVAMAPPPAALRDHLRHRAMELAAAGGARRA